MATVLVVDDRDTDRELLVTMLEFAGYAVLTARTGVEALGAPRPSRARRGRAMTFGFFDLWGA